MLLKTNCPNCGVSLSVSADIVGKTARCPKCQTRFVITDVRTATSARSLEQAADAAETRAEHSAQQTASGTGHPAASPIKSLARFEIREVLGQGGFGRVYLAYDPQLERMLALKVPTFGPQDVGKARRFQDEAKSAAQLRHPNIVPTFESGISDGQYFIASQYISGQPLSAVIKSGRVAFRDAATWCAKIADALAYAHDMRIIHRDVKPHNVMLDERGEPQLMDFGLAKRLDDEAALTTEGALLGTPAYMSPEQARGDSKHIGAHSDQYSVGAMLYELLTGARAFDGAPHSVIAQIVSQEPRPPQSLNPEIPGDLAAITQKAMSKEITGRYPGCGELAADLRRWLAGEPTLARPITSFERLTRWARRNRGLATAFGATASALLLAAVLGIALASYQSFAKKKLVEANAQILSEQGKTLEALATATSEKERAEAQSMLAEERRRAEETQRDAAQHQAYVATVRLAASKWDGADAAGMNAALNLVRPPPGQQDRRGWEWNYLWNQSHSDLKTLRLTEGLVSSVAISPDGARVVGTDARGEFCRLWNADQTPVHPDLFAIVGRGVGRAEFSPDGSWFAVAGGKGQIGVCDAGTGELRFTLPGHGTLPSGGLVRLQAIAISPDGLFMATGSSDDQTIKLWDLTAKTEKWSVSTAEYVFDVAFSPDGRLLASANENRATAFLWDAGTGQQVRQFPLEGRTTGVSYHPDGRSLAFARMDAVEIRDVGTGALVRTVREAKTRMDRVCFSPDGTQLLIHGGANAQVWDVATGEKRLDLRGHEQRILSACFSRDGRTLYSGDVGGTVKVWDAQTGGADAVLSFGDEHARKSVIPGVYVSNLQFLENGQKVVSLGTRPTVWDVASGQLETLFQPPPVSGNPRWDFVAVTPDLQVMFGRTSPFDNTLIAWSCESGNELYRLSNLEVGAVQLAFDAVGSPRRRFAVSQNSTDSIAIRNCGDGLEVHRFQQAGSSTAMAFSADGGLFAAGGYDYAVTVWRSDSAVPTQVLKGHDGVVFSIDISPRGDRLVSGSGMLSTGDMGDNSIRVWNVAQGQQELLIRGHQSGVKRVKFTADGERIVSQGDDGLVKLWHARTGEELLALGQPASTGASVQADPQGNWLLVGSTRQPLATLWDGRPESALALRAAERQARSAVAWFRGQGISAEALAAALQRDSSLTAEARKLALEFAARPAVRIVQFK